MPKRQTIDMSKFEKPVPLIPLIDDKQTKGKITLLTTGQRF